MLNPKIPKRSMDIIFSVLIVWWLAGLLGFRRRRPRRRPHRRDYGRPTLDHYDYEEFQRRNAK